WREWQKRPRFYQKDVHAITAVLPNGTRWAVESGENLWATSTFARPRQVDAHAVEGDYFTIKKYDLSSGRVFTPQEAELGAPVVVIGDEVAKFFFPGLNALGRELRVGGLPYQVIGVIDHQGYLFGIWLDKLVIAPFSSPMHRLTNPRGEIMNTMHVAVTDRTREIGIQTSLGARHPDILGQFLAEAATSSTLGALIGIVLCITLAKGIAWKFPFLPAAVAP